MGRFLQRPLLYNRWLLEQPDDVEEARVVRDAKLDEPELSDARKRKHFPSLIALVEQPPSALRRPLSFLSPERTVSSHTAERRRLSAGRAPTRSSLLRPRHGRKKRADTGEKLTRGRIKKRAAYHVQYMLLDLVFSHPAILDEQSAAFCRQLLAIRGPVPRPVLGAGLGQRIDRSRLDPGHFGLELARLK